MYPQYTKCCDSHKCICGGKIESRLLVVATEKEYDADAIFGYYLFSKSAVIKNS